MRGLQPKRVSWASDGNLCQVKLFLSEDAPSQVALDAQDHLQPKKSSSGLRVTGSGSGPDDSLPPGFEEFSPENQLKNKLAQIPLVKWRRPPRFVLNADWLVVAGGDSQEVEIENRRELRVLEAIYPRASSIPENAAISSDVENSHYDDGKTPLVPMTPIEDEETAADVSSAFAAPVTAPISPHVPSLPQGAPQSAHPQNPHGNGGLAPAMATTGQMDIVAALTALARSNEQGSLIDHDLLRSIISNPGLLQDMLGCQGASNGQAVQGAASHVVQTPPMHEPSQRHLNKMDAAVRQASNVPYYSQINGTAAPGFHPQPHTGAVPGFLASSSPPGSMNAPGKDMNYYKSLIQQHGGDRVTETAPLSAPAMPPYANNAPAVPLYAKNAPAVPPYANNQNQHPGTNFDLSDNSRPRDSKHPRIMKPCIYFNTSKGCRRGDSCAYQHDASAQHRAASIPEVQSAKRMKMDRDIRGGSQSYS